MSKQSEYLIFETLLSNINIDFEKEFMIKNLMKEPKLFKHKHRCDYVIKKDDKIKFIVEIEGGTFTNGRHNKGVGFWNDCLKYNAIIIAGYPLLRFPAIMVKQTPIQVVDYVKSYLDSMFNTSDLSEFIKNHKK